MTTAPRHLVLPLRLNLAYTHGLGELSPHFRGLLEGRAVAAGCPACSKAWCPPLLACPSDGSPTSWIELAGTGTVVSATRTVAALPMAGEARACVFALARLDGAENCLLARMEAADSMPPPGQRVRLVRAPGDWPHPAQTALLAPI
jgi:uncharacterized OB-fold protein